MWSKRDSFQKRKFSLSTMSIILMRAKDEGWSGRFLWGQRRWRQSPFFPDHRNIRHCIHFLPLYNKSQKTVAYNNMHLLSHSLYESGVWSHPNQSSGKCLSRLQSTCWPGLHTYSKRGRNHGVILQFCLITDTMSQVEKLKLLEPSTR